MGNAKLSKILYGGDYNPEQWPRDIWDEDMGFFEKAGIDIATINVFNWAYNQPDEETYNFEQLDEVVEMLEKNNIRISMGTSTAAHPAWMAKRYPDVLIVDYNGRKRKFGIRHNSCPNSPTYRKYAERMASKLAERYKDVDIPAWHVSNEMGVRCYCDNCEKAFRVWLRKKYKTLDNLNRAWYTRFWGHTFYDWDEIVLPSGLSEGLGQHKTAFQGITADYYRFNSDSHLECYLLEYNAIKKHIPDAVVTTNFHSNGTYKPHDYFKWAEHMDVIALDMYPTLDMTPSFMAMRYDLMRGLKDGDPFLLMESVPNVLNWKTTNEIKPPGVMRLWSYHAISRGSDSVMFFQMRRSFGAYEFYHGAVIDHVGHENTRVFREISELGHELQKLGDTLVDARVSAKVGILFDWDNWWAVEMTSGPSLKLEYLSQVQQYYDALYANRIQVDMIHVDSDFDDYDLVVAPLLYMVKPGLTAKLEAYVEKGGTFVTSFHSGIVDEDLLVKLGGYPGELRKLLGVWVEETDALKPEKSNAIVMKQPYGELNGSYSCDFICDLMHAEGAEVIAEYGDDFYQGMPVVTKNKFGKGEAWYIASQPEPEFLAKWAAELCRQKGIESLPQAPEQVEVTRREKDGKVFTFYLNHGDEAANLVFAEEKLELISGKKLSGETILEAKDVLIVQE